MTVATQAFAKLTAQLQCSIEAMHAIRPLDLPLLVGSNVFGPAPENKDHFIEYPSTWTGLAVGSCDGQTTYWFIGRDEENDEREFVCLGNESTMSELIAAALVALASNLEFWSAKAA